MAGSRGFRDGGPIPGHLVIPVVRPSAKGITIISGGCGSEALRVGVGFIAVDRPKFSEHRHEMGQQKNKSKARNSYLIALFDLSCHRWIHCTLGTSHEMVSVHLVASPFIAGATVPRECRVRA